ncbi:hypothetical protein IKE19_01940 [Candidatus Saccharibacteria bacterium]|nr:hypothetical protein [Candidatus Saccharibacteria bacterium]
MSFRFLGYDFDETTGVAEFRYQSEKDGFIEKVQFDVKDAAMYDTRKLDAALFLAFVVLGTSYYKVRAGRKVELGGSLDEWQAKFFDKVYQEGLSQFAYENGLVRGDLAEFEISHDSESSVAFEDKSRVMGAPEIIPKNRGSLVMVSGGKDSILAAEMIRESGEEYRVAYITAQESYPSIVDEISGGTSPIIIRRWIDKEGLKRAGGMNGHVPVTIINEALAVVQAVLLGFSRVELGVGKEGLEPHAWIKDLPVNHQWSKTPEAQELFNEYVRRYVADDITVGSVLKQYDELEIAELFAKKCWEKYGHKFSSCNVANYKQGADNRELKWCGKCAKCANSYLLFSPFVPYEEQLKIFGRDLFTDTDLTEIYKGLLGVDGVMKPFECVASVEELRKAYRERLPGYGELLFEV